MTVADKNSLLAQIKAMEAEIAMRTENLKKTNPNHPLFSKINGPSPLQRAYHNGVAAFLSKHKDETAKIKAVA